MSQAHREHFDARAIDPDLDGLHGAKYAGVQLTPPPAQELLQAYTDDTQALGESGRKFSDYTLPEDRRVSVLLNTSDEIQMNLLAHTASMDANHYEVLSYEELNRLKGDYGMLSNRIEALRKNLAFESKVRDAAVNLSRLHSKASKRLSRQAEEEMAISNRKMEGFAMELWRLTSRASIIQQKIVEHTAGVLSVTHPISKNPQRSSMSTFDDRHRYKSANGLGRDLYEQPQNLDDYNPKLLERLRDCNGRFIDILGLPLLAPSSRQNLANELQLLDSNLSALQEGEEKNARLLARDESTQGILVKLWDLMQLNVPDENDKEILPFSVPDFASKTHDLVSELLRLREYLRDSEKSKTRLRDENQAIRNDVLKAEESAMQRNAEFETSQRALLGVRVQHEETQIELEKEHQSKLAAAESEVRLHCEQMRDLRGIHLTCDDKIRSLNLEISGLREDLTEKDHNVRQLTEQLDPLIATASQSDKDMKHLEAERQFRRDTETSLASKVLEYEELDRRYLKLRLNVEDSKTDMQSKIDDLKVRNDILSTDLAQMTTARNNFLEESKTASFNLMREQKQSAITIENVHQLEQDVIRLNTEIASLKQKLDEVYGSRQQRMNEAAAAAHSAAIAAVSRDGDGNQRLSALQKQIESLHTENAMLRCRATDENRPLPHPSEEGNALRRKCRMLQSELNDMLGNFEGLTKEMIIYENERIHLDAQLDEVRDKCSSLETLLADEKVKLLGLRRSTLQSKDGTLEEPTSATALRHEFRKIVQEMRIEQVKSLKVWYFSLTLIVVGAERTQITGSTNTINT